MKTVKFMQFLGKSISGLQSGPGRDGEGGMCHFAVFWRRFSSILWVFKKLQYFHKSYLFRNFTDKMGSWRKSLIWHPAGCQKALNWYGIMYVLDFSASQADGMLNFRVILMDFTLSYGNWLILCSCDRKITPPHSAEPLWIPCPFAEGEGPGTHRGGKTAISAHFTENSTKTMICLHFCVFCSQPLWKQRPNEVKLGPRGRIYAHFRENERN